MHPKALSHIMINISYGTAFMLLVGIYFYMTSITFTPGKCAPLLLKAMIINAEEVGWLVLLGLLAL